MKLPLLFASRYLHSKKSLSVINTTATVSSVAIGVAVAAMVILMSVYNGFDTLLRQMYDTVEPDLTITPARGKTFKADAEQEKALLSALAEKLSALEGVRINGAHEAPHILSLSIPGVPTQNTINILQDHGICVSAGSACAKGHRSHVLTAMKVPEKAMDGSFRVSLCRDTTQEELDQLFTVIRDEILPRAR